MDACTLAMRESRGGYRESGTPWKTNKFYRKRQLGSITLEKVGPADIFDPPCSDSGKIIVSLK